MPEMEYVCKPEAKTIKKETDFEGAFSPVDKRVSAFKKKMIYYHLCNYNNDNTTIGSRNKDVIHPVTNQFTIKRISRLLFLW